MCTPLNVLRLLLLKGNFLTTRHFIRRYKTIPKGTQMVISRGGSSMATWVIHNKSLPGLGKIQKSNGDTWVIRSLNEVPIIETKRRYCSFLFPKCSDFLFVGYSLIC